MLVLYGTKLGEVEALQGRVGRAGVTRKLGGIKCISSHHEGILFRNGLDIFRKHLL